MLSRLCYSFTCLFFKFLHFWYQVYNSTVPGWLVWKFSFRGPHFSLAGIPNDPKPTLFLTLTFLSFHHLISILETLHLHPFLDHVLHFCQRSLSSLTCSAPIRIKTTTATSCGSVTHRASGEPVCIKLDKMRLKSGRRETVKLAIFKSPHRPVLWSGTREDASGLISGQVMSSF